MCGIAGIINLKGKRDFDYATFCTLGINNDTRGGDSCGIFIDGEVEYGVNKKKLFEDFFEESELIKKTKKCMISLVHCRKASVGKISEQTAQPVVLKNDKGNVEYVLLHNGTIHNYEDLAKKYIPEVNIEGLTDSQVMARIFYHSGYDVLEEYIGGSVFFMVDYRPSKPEVRLFKGESKKTEYSKETTEERPFYFILNENEMVFSSIEKYLHSLRRDKVYTAVSNALIILENNNVFVEKKYDRSKVCQSKPYRSTIPSYSPGIDYDYNWGSFGNSFYTDKPTKKYGKSESSYTRSIVCDKTKNLYKASGDLLDGKTFISVFGIQKLNKEKGYHEVWFYNGVALRGGKKVYDSLKLLAKKLGLTKEEFFNYFETIIRFYSFDRLFVKNGMVYEAISTTEYVPFTGKYQALGDIFYSNCFNGFRDVIPLQGDRDYPFSLFKKWETVTKLNKIYKQCTLSMNSQA